MRRYFALFVVIFSLNIITFSCYDEDTTSEDQSTESISQSQAVLEPEFLYTLENGEATIIQITNSNGQTELEFPASIDGYPVVALGGHLLFNNNTVEVVILPEGLESINGNTFENCFALRQINLPDSLTYLGSNAFINCQNLTSINIPPGITEIFYMTFGNTGLTSITIGPNVTVIHMDAFYQCAHLISVTFSEGLLYIESEAFYESGLISVSLPEGVINVGSAFTYSPNLVSLTLPDSLEDLPDYSGTAVRSVTVPPLVRNIPDEKFMNMTSLQNVYISSQVSWVGRDAFKGCTNVTIHIASGTDMTFWDPYWNPDNRPIG